GAVDGRRHGRIEGERDLPGVPEADAPRLDPDVLGLYDQGQLAFERLDLRGGGGVVLGDLDRPIGRGLRVADLTREDHDDPEGDEGGRDPADAALRDPDDR